MYRIVDGQIRISVRNLVEFVMQSGDLDNRSGSYRDKKAMLKGAKIHKTLQDRAGSEYRAEVPLKHEIACPEYSILLEGRADGIFTRPDGVTAIDEIKSMYADVEHFTEPVAVHRAQALCYAYIFALQNGRQQMGVRMTYCNIKTMKVRYFDETLTFEQLEDWFSDVLLKLTKWFDFLMDHRRERNASIPSIAFPFPYRNGQKQLVVSAYKTIAAGKKLYIEAPTGIGKTMSAVFPSVSAMGQGLADKIFYLTAKTITRTVAQEAFDILRRNGLVFKSMILTAKEKLCILESPDCNPEACPYARGFFDRINDAVFYLVTHYDCITREDILKVAEEYQVCPFELSLDASYWVDALICDYNYVFDPDVRLARFFAGEERGDYVFLIDEAHNLVERAREMYSAVLSHKHVKEAKAMAKESMPMVAPKLDRLQRQLSAMKKTCVAQQEEKEILDAAQLPILYDNVYTVFSEMEKFYEEHPEFKDRDLLDFYFELRSFLLTYEAMDESYVAYLEPTDEDLLVHLFCVHPATRLLECMHQGRSSILFSATLLPIRYYKELLGAEEEDYAITVPSPFDPEKRLLGVVNGISTVYTRRGPRLYESIARNILNIVKEHAGNYMAFFPSYRMMWDVGEVLETMAFHQGRKIEFMYQQQDMSERDREDFLSEFAENEDGVTRIGMAIMGGIFSEGIDLVRESLIGVLIVGTGLPQVCMEREILRDYFEETMGKGFEYAYLFPGITKVLQAAGRLVRTADDYGVIALMDERFLKQEYREQFPREWSNGKVWNDDMTMIKDLRDYWARMEEK